MVLLGGRKYRKKNVKEGKGFFGDMFRKGRNYLTDKLYKRNPIFNFVRNPNIPTNKLLQQIAEDSYNKSTKQFIGEYVNIFKNDTLNIYLNKSLKTIVIGVRGTASGGDALADLKIANGSLNTSTRYKNDLKNIKNIQKIYSIAEYKYFGSGHSLAGAILDLLLKGGYIRQAVSYNPAVEKNEMGNSNNLRIYNDDDALYNLLGKYANNVEVRKNKNKLSNPITNTLNAHKMEQFIGGASRINITIPTKTKLTNVFEKMNKLQLHQIVKDYNLQQKIKGYTKHTKNTLIELIKKHMKFENGEFVSVNDEKRLQNNGNDININNMYKKGKEIDKKNVDEKEKKRLERNEKARLKRLEKKKKEEPKKKTSTKKWYEDDEFINKHKEDLTKCFKSILYSSYYKRNQDYDNKNKKKNDEDYLTSHQKREILYENYEEYENLLDDDSILSKPKKLNDLNYELVKKDLKEYIDAYTNVMGDEFIDECVERIKKGEKIDDTEIKEKKKKEDEDKKKKEEEKKKNNLDNDNIIIDFDNLNQDIKDKIWEKVKEDFFINSSKQKVVSYYKIIAGFRLKDKYNKLDYIRDFKTKIDDNKYNKLFDIIKNDILNESHFKDYMKDMKKIIDDNFNKPDDEELKGEKPEQGFTFIQKLYEKGKNLTTRNINYDSAFIVGDILTMLFVKKYNYGCPLFTLQIKEGKEHWAKLLKSIERCVENGDNTIMIGFSLKGHRNLIIIKVDTREVLRFEPHGAGYMNRSNEKKYQQRQIKYENYVFEFTEFINEYFELKKKKFVYKGSSEICPRKPNNEIITEGFQSIEGDAKRAEKRELNIKRDNESGWCQMWSMFFIECVIRNEGMDIREVYKKAYEAMNNQPKYFLSVIRGYYTDVNEWLSENKNFTKDLSSTSLKTISSKDIEKELSKLIKTRRSKADRQYKKVNIKGSGFYVPKI